MPSSEVMHKWKHHELHSGSKHGPEVKSHAQAVAIMLSEKRKEEAHGGHYPDRASGGGVAQRPKPPLSPQMQAIRDRIAAGEMKVEQAPTWTPPSADVGGQACGGVVEKAMGGPMMGPPMMGGGMPMPPMTPMTGAPNGVAPGAGSPMSGMMTGMGTPMAGIARGAMGQMGVAPQQLAGGGIAQTGVGSFNMAKQASVNPSPIARAEERNVMHGPVMSSVPGRTDAHKVAVPSGSYVIPADVVSGRGQGNTAAGMNTLQRLFKMGPYGTAGGMPHPGHTIPKPMAPPKMQGIMASSGGGKDSHVGHPVPVNIAGGELVVPPENLMSEVHPDLKTAHEIMDKWVVHERKSHIKTLSKLPGPVKD